MKNLKVVDMVKVHIPWLDKDALCLQLETLRFVVICYDRDIDEWKTVSLFDFDHMESLKDSGKRYPICGMLQSYLQNRQSGFVFIADDTILGKVTFTDSKPK